MTKQATLYLTGSLRDFLKNKQQKSSPLNITFELNPSVKDLIESRGIPHTAIFKLEVNGRERSFDYNVREGDEITPYPFEKVDATTLDDIFSSPSKFVLDVHLGKLAKTLRLLGIDTSWDADWEESKILHLSNRQKRMILSRNIGLLRNGEARYGYWVRATDPDKQVQELFKRFNISDYISPFSRCMKCNGLLEEVELSQVEERVPPKVQEWHSLFYECLHCRQVYWEGSHYKKLQEKVNRLTPD